MARCEILDDPTGRRGIRRAQGGGESMARSVIVYCDEAFGIEWDWFATDLAGHVAFLSSGGSGQVPPLLAAHAALIEELLALAGIRCDAHSWQVAAEFGLYGYDVNLNGGPFRRRAAPARPKRAEDLPIRFRPLVRQVVVQGHFDELRSIACDQFDY